METEEYNDEDLRELGDRLRRIRRILDLSQKDFSAGINISASYVSDIEKGKIKPGYNFLLLIAEKYNINPTWVLLEEGAIFLDGKETSRNDQLNFGNNHAQVAKLLQYMKESPYVYAKIMSFFIPLLYENEDLITKDIKTTETREKDQSLISFAKNNS